MPNSRRWLDVDVQRPWSRYLVARVGGLLVAVVVMAHYSVAAPAADHPAYLPTRDVAITYRLSSDKPGVPKVASVFFSASSQKLRLDDPSLGGYAVIDRAERKMMVVMTKQRSFSWLPFDEKMADGFILNDSMTFKRTGTDVVAGLRCTTWDVTSANAAGSVCITDDGVLLRGDGHDKKGAEAGLEAKQVTYAPQPASLFKPPSGFFEIGLPLRTPSAKP